VTDNTDKLPKQELLIKLLRMTESDNDAESLTALRKVNAFMKSAGWDWERLINSKIRIVEDPFKNLGQPQSGPSKGPIPTQAPRPAAAAPQPAQPTTKKAWPLGIQPNRFSGWCYCCGLEVLANAGVIFRPNQFHSLAPADWRVACTLCNTTAIVTAYAANRRRTSSKRGGSKPFVSDLS
jgi:hypothetical protein